MTRGIKRKRQLTTEDKNKFFSELSSKAGCSTDVDFVKRVYYSLIKVLMLSVREKGYIELPDLGMFYLMEWSGKIHKSRWTGQAVDVKPVRILKFKNHYNLKKYIQDMDAKVVW